MLSEEIIEMWKKDYDSRKKSLLEACKAETDVDAKALLLQTVAKKTRVLEEAFKELSLTRKTDGNLVPLVIADIVASNVADMAVNTMMLRVLQGAPLGLVKQEIKTFTYMELAAPFCMDSWENLQKDLIDQAISEEEYNK